MCVRLSLNSAAVADCEARQFIRAVLILLMMGPLVRPAEATANDRQLEQFRQKSLLLCFQGKGSCLPYDAGVLHEAYARIPALREGQTIVAGNSSGAIPAAYFGCFGFSDRTVAYAEQRLRQGNRDAVRGMENPQAKIAKFVRGKPTEISHTDLIEYISFALGVDRWHDATSIQEVVRRSTARPQFPCLIVACNREVLEDRHPESPLFSGRLKQIDLATLAVSWTPEAFAYYQQHPAQFKREHPGLTLGKDPYIGQAVTYFVDASLFELLRQVPASERLGDLRLMTDAADIALAILASCSEPTYFPAVTDPHPEKIMAFGALGDLGCVRRRTYYGGYLISLPAQDIRRMLPGLRVLGTGWRHNPLEARLILRNWLLADCEDVAFRSEWWSDMEVNPDREFESHMVFRDLTSEEEFEFGRKRAQVCFDQDDELPAFVQPPAYRYAAAHAIFPAHADEEMYSGEVLANGNRTLKTLRGLGPLLRSAVSPNDPSK